MLNPDIWHDEKFVTLKVGPQLLFIGLISHADDEGYITADAQSLRCKIFPGKSHREAPITVWLATLEQTEMAIRWCEYPRSAADENSEDFLQLPNWERHQTINRPRPSTIKPRCQVSVRCQSDAGQVSVRCRSGIGQVSVRHTSAKKAPLGDNDLQESVTPNGRERKGTEGKGSARRTRAPTAAENHFILGFKDQYGDVCEIKRDHAIALARKVGTHGIETVKRKIDGWWGHRLPETFSGRKTVGAFIAWFDSIGSSRRGDPGNDPGRFDAATADDATVARYGAARIGSTPATSGQGAG